MNATPTRQMHALTQPVPSLRAGKRQGLLRVWTVGLLLALLMLPGLSAVAASGAQTHARTGGSANSSTAAGPLQRHPIPPLLNADGTLKRNIGWSGALDLAGWQVRLDAERGPVLRPTGSASAWWPFGPAPSAHIGGIVISGSDMYVCGDFTSVGNVAANHIAKWDGAVWSALGTGTDDMVQALAASGGDIYVGGLFTSAGGVPNTAHIARWDGSAWWALGTGVDAPVSAIAIIGSNVYAGGPFAHAGGVQANDIARWDGSAWSALGAGLDATVYTLATDGSNLYAGGDFTHAGGLPANYIARWDGSAWSALGTGTSSFVMAIAVSGSSVYAGGSFSQAGGVPVNYIARWDGSTWSALDTGASFYVSAIATNGSDVYVGGFFDSAGGVANTRYIARWDGSAWSALGTGTNDNVYGLVINGSDLYAFGPFTSAGGVADTAYIARYGPPSTNANLGNLALSSGALAPSFAPGITAYSANVPYAVASLTVTPTVSDFYATVTVNGTPVSSGSPSEPIALTVGANMITMVVTAQDGTTTRTYTVSVTRAATADLSNLVLSSGVLMPRFASDITAYTATVASCASGITVTPTALDPPATITVNGALVASGHASGSIALNFGLNTITTAVTGQGGALARTYTVTVTRAASLMCTPAGGTWTKVSSPVTHSDWDLNAVAMVSSDEGWAVGGKGLNPNGSAAGPFIIRWNGNTWSQVSISDTDPNNTYWLRSTAMLSANDGWAVGGSGGAFPFGVVLRWDGHTWSRWKTDTVDLRSVATISTSDIWAVGGARLCQGYLCESVSATCHWNGTVWHEVFNHGWNRLYAVAMIAPDDGWAVGWYGEIKHWDGNTWADLNSYDASLSLYSVAMVSADDGWAVGDSAIMHWNGRDWRQVGNPVTNTLNSVTMVSSTDGWAVGDNGTIRHWNGDTWGQVSSPVTQTLKSVTMISANEGWAVGQSGVILHYTNFRNVFLPVLVR